MRDALRARPLEIRLRDAYARADEVELPTVKEEAALRRFIQAGWPKLLAVLALLLGCGVPVVLLGGALEMDIEPVETVSEPGLLTLRQFGLGLLVLALAGVAFGIRGVVVRLRELKLPTERRLGEVLEVSYDMERPIRIPFLGSDWRLKLGPPAYTLSLNTEDDRQTSHSGGHLASRGLVEGDVIVAFTRGTFLLATRKLPV